VEPVLTACPVAATKSDMRVRSTLSLRNTLYVGQRTDSMFDLHSPFARRHIHADRRKQKMDSKLNRRENRSAERDWRGTPVQHERRVAWQAPWFRRIFDRRTGKASARELEHHRQAETNTIKKSIALPKR